MARRYGAWGGWPRGYPERKDKCVAEVANGHRFFQCYRKRGHGPGGQYCKQHAKMVEAGQHVYVPQSEE